MLFHNGNVKRDSFSDKEFMALNISITTRIDRDIVVPFLAERSTNMLQPISGNKVEQEWKWLYHLIVINYQLIKGNLRAFVIKHKPPSVAKYGSSSYVNSNNHVSKIINIKTLPEK